MPKDLFVFDISPFVHAGSVNKFARLESVVNAGVTWQTLRIPCGGVSLIFNELYAVAGKGDCVFCADRNPTIKKEMCSTYKSNRDHKETIQVNKAVAEYILQACGGTVIARAGYEADDIIYTIVQKVYNEYDNIYIYTGDSDMYFLVDQKVSIRPSSSRAKAVDIYNYEQVLAKYGARYNSMTVQKILGGDKSDCIPALPKDVVAKLSTVLYNPNFLPKLGSAAFVKEWVGYLAPEALPQVDLVFPLEVEDVPVEFGKLDTRMIRCFGAEMHNKMFHGMGDPAFDIKSHIDEMIKRGYYLEETP